MKKLRLVIISERTRYHFQKPLQYFKNIEIFHLYKTHYSDMDPKDFGSNLIKYNNVFDLYSKLRKINPDLIQGMEPYYGYSRLKIPLKVLPILFTTFIYSKLNRKPYFFHILENILPKIKYGSFAGWIMKKMAQIYSGSAKFIFYLNIGARGNLLSLGINESKIHHGLWGIWGVDIQEFSPTKTKNEIKNIIFVGRLTQQKGIEDFAEAIKLISNSHYLKKDYKFQIAGRGELEEALKLKIKNEKIDNLVDFLGEVPSRNIHSIYQNAYLTVSPSRTLNNWAEQIGVNNLESMACGVPVVSTFSGSISEFVSNNKTGILVNEKNPKELADAIAKLLDDEKLRNELAKNCRKYAIDKFDAQKNIPKLEEFVISQMKNE